MAANSDIVFSLLNRKLAYAAAVMVGQLRRVWLWTQSFESPPDFSTVSRFLPNVGPIINLNNRVMLFAYYVDVLNNYCDFIVDYYTWFNGLVVNRVANQVKLQGVINNVLYDPGTSWPNANELYRELRRWMYGDRLLPTPIGAGLPNRAFAIDVAYRANISTGAGVYALEVAGDPDATHRTYEVQDYYITAMSHFYLEDKVYLDFVYFLQQKNMFRDGGGTNLFNLARLMLLEHDQLKPYYALSQLELTYALNNMLVVFLSWV